jgi:7,8-dihydroneopterin aldolase/epimerase/oxygenase
MQSFIGFHQHKVHCIIGVLPHERLQEQEIHIDLKVKADFKHPAETDSLANTIDYIVLAEICTNLAKTNQYHLIETLAWEALHKIFERFPVKWAWIRVQKPSAIPSGYAYVELEKG